MKNAFEPKAVGASELSHRQLFAHDTLSIGISNSGPPEKPGVLLAV